jgi:WD40 repeat protein
VWDLQEGTWIAEFTGESRLLACAILPDGKTIVAGERSGRLHFLKLEGLDDGNSPYAES